MPDKNLSMQHRSWTKYWCRWRGLFTRLRRFGRHGTQPERQSLTKQPALSAVKNPSPSEISLEILPPQIVRRVFDYLPLLDEACLALTCKRFHGLFQSVFQHTELRSQPSDTTETQPLRTDFLLRLEDPSWQYCMKCLALHRQHEPHTDADPAPGATTEVPGDRGSDEKVQACPCMSMSRWQRLQLMRKLESRCIQLSDQTFLLDGMRFCCSESDQGHHMTTHECAVADHPYLTNHTSCTLELASEMPGNFKYSLVIEHNIRLRPAIFHSDTDTRTIPHMAEIMAYIKSCHQCLAAGVSEWRQVSSCKSSRQVILEEKSPRVDYLPGTEVGHLVIRASQRLSLTAPPFTFDFRCLPFGPCII